ncbi:MTG1 [Blepharisma stoltei]|uniref:Mitochondrial GTPase 1 n=1 Tax=Blepharisma stoltei TaxID=1481888 RepID=A0AAU9IAU7_9CILI|nr:unnamed protein product [Blepharisma stoltei]
MSMTSQFRSHFPIPKINWFPGHMKKATDEMLKKIKKCDVFIEVRDARIPYSSSNTFISKNAIDKPKIVILNKMDLCSVTYTNQLAEKIKDECDKVLLFSAATNQNINLILDAVKKIVPPKFKTVGSWMMIGGVPNVGKSSIINSLRRKSKAFNSNKEVATTGPEPCVTRGVQGFKVSMNPLLYVIDTPGIMLPRLDNAEKAIRLALIGAIRDDVVGADVICDYLLFCLNKHRMFDYVKKYDLPGPTDVLEEVLLHLQKKYHWDDQALCKAVIKHFREGKLGRITLDRINEY